MKNIGSSSNMSPWRSYSGSRVEIAVVIAAGVLSLSRCTPGVVNTESTDGLHNVPYCRVFLAQSHRASERPLILWQIRSKFIQNWRQNLKTLLKRESPYYRPKYERSSPSSSNNRLSGPTTAQSRTAHNRTSKCNRLSFLSPLFCVNMCERPDIYTKFKVIQ